MKDRRSTRVFHQGRNASTTGRETGQEMKAETFPAVLAGDRPWKRVWKLQPGKFVLLPLSQSKYLNDMDYLLSSFGQPLTTT